MQTITVFGSAAPRYGDNDYAQAMTLGRLLAESGYAVASGGYAGTMEAISRGANEAGGRAYGITCSTIANKFNISGPNAWVTDEIRHDDLNSRIVHLMTHNSGIVVLPGGIGTFAELGLALNALQIDELSPRPIVLLGQIWRDTFDMFLQAGYIKQYYFDLVSFVDTPQQAVDAILNYKSRAAA